MSKLFELPNGAFIDPNTVTEVSDVFKTTVSLAIRIQLKGDGVHLIRFKFNEEDIAKKEQIRIGQTINQMRD